MPDEASANTPAQTKQEETEPAAVNTAAPAKKPKRKYTRRAPKTSAPGQAKPAARKRVAKPGATTRTGTKAPGRQLDLIAAAARADAAFGPDGPDNNNNSGSSSSGGGGPAVSVSAFSAPREPRPPPQPAAEVFSLLPPGHNPIDRTIFDRLALVWNEEASHWTTEMQQSVLANLPRARVTRSTATFANHYVSRTVQQRGLVPSWGQFIVMRTMFGPARCFRTKWAAALAQRYPMTRYDAYEGVVPTEPQVIRDVLDGKVAMPTPGRRMESVVTLSKERTRRRGPKRKTSKAKKEEPADDEELDVKRKREEEERGREEFKMAAAAAAEEDEDDDEMPTVKEETWMATAAAAAALDPTRTVAQMRKKYYAQVAEMKRLRESNAQIQQHILKLNQLCTVAQEL